MDKKNFGKLGFSASSCFGECPSMRIVIDNNKTMYFHGVKFTDKIGYYKSQLPDSIYIQFEEIFNNLVDEKYKPRVIYLDAPADAQQYYFKFLNSDGSEVKYDVLIGQRELELFLLTLYKRVKLVESDSLQFITPVM